MKKNVLSVKELLQKKVILLSGISIGVMGIAQVKDSIKSTDIESVVITGYKKEKKENVTASIATMKTAELKTLPNANVTNSLEGKMAGVQLLTDNSPGGGNAIRVRGYSTINNNDPLVIVDGVPAVNGLNSINSADIESFQVLKDAASASVYGARAANGVVIITTKNGGKNDKLSVQLDGYYGVQNVFNLPKMLSAKDYANLLWQAAKNDGIAPKSDIYGSNPNAPVIPEFLDKNKTIRSGNTDWVKEIFRPAAIQNYNLSLARGGKIGNQYFSLSYTNQEGVIKYTGFERFQARFNSQYNIAEIFTIGENLNATYSKNVAVQTNSALGSVVYDAMQFPSIVPVYDISGNYAGNPINDIGNPLARLYRNKDNKENVLKLLGNVFAEVKVNKFKLRSSVGIDFQNFNQRSFSAKFNEILSSSNTNTLRTSNNFNYQTTITNTLSYNNKFGKHQLDLLAGQETVKFHYENFYASRQGFILETPNFWYLDSGTLNQLNGGTAYEWSLQSLFGQATYNYDQKYLFTGTIRRDGTSMLANNKYGVFPAFSLGWRVDRENFFTGAKNFMTLMLRGGWGVTGNQQVPSYSTIDSYRNFDWTSNYALDGGQNTVYSGLTQSRNANPSLKWETTNQTSVGVDMTFLRKKLQISADYYTKLTSDILVYTDVPLTTGGTSDGIWKNDGKMTNNGFELTASYNDKIGDLGVGLSTNFTTYKNKLTELKTANYLGLPTSALHNVNFDQEVSRSAVGQPIGSFYGYVTDGIFQSAQEVTAYGMQPVAKPGDFKFKDINGDGKIDANDRTYIGSPHPDFLLGFNINLDYKNFDLGMFFNGSFGNKIYNLSKYKSMFFNQSAYNKSEDIKGAWTPENTGATIPRLSMDDKNNNIRVSDYFVEDGSYFKLNNLALGYTFNKDIVKDVKMRIFAQMTNVFTITKYSGLTPQIGLQNYGADNRNLDIGVDRGVYPPARTVSFGFNMNF